VSLYAQTTPQTNICNTNEVVIAFFNGVKNTHSMAIEYREALRKFYGETTPNGETISYELLYNESTGIIDDLIEVFEQRMGELKDESGCNIQNVRQIF
jgi:hypothetical protein